MSARRPLSREASAFEALCVAFARRHCPLGNPHEVLIKCVELNE